ncbi:SurA N-terminal domain-containing protein [Colwellia sp. BRX8-7]|jgi:hypothetical protein|uniref:SurA N-terminal domain-containing protein n=1 Tax=unclassified Colwellia TaxID=196834 RepID=UPI0015F36259|nr:MULTISPECIES: SurA N-terminal domain-containing protein [unclassified Colwellia]MBA6339283.1 SurA N-terminal domain-containing protein [Colwellia sp. BRX8-7]MBA6399868.1 SurA N-terminal domain-containing protein [Colwellia sp. BRX10-4]
MKMVQLLTYAFVTLMVISSFSGNSGTYKNEKIALVFGETIYLKDLEPEERELDRYKRSYPDLSTAEIVNRVHNSKLTSLIWKQVVSKFSENYDVEPSQEEVDDYINAMEALSSERPKSEANWRPTEIESEEINEQISNIYKDFVRTYKISKKLYELYGGVVIFQQGNPLEPVGAYRKLLEFHESNKDFVIYNKESKTSFWDYYVREHRSIIPEDKVDYTVPWWKRALEK